MVENEEKSRFIRLALILLIKEFIREGGIIQIFATKTAVTFKALFGVLLIQEVELRSIDLFHTQPNLATPTRTLPHPAALCGHTRPHF